MGRNFIFRVIPFCVIFSVFLPVSADAQQDGYFKRDKNISVKERPKPEYYTEGIRSGSIIYQPQLTLQSEFDDNVFATDQNQTSDIIAVIAPSLSIQTDRSVHSLNIDLGAESRQYLEEESESYTNYGIAADGQLDVREDSHISVGGNFRRFHEGRNAVGAARNSIDPIEIDEAGANIGYYQEFGRTRFQVGYSFQDTDFKDGQDAAGNVLEQDFRDRERIGLEARADYAVSPDTSLFARVRAFDENYKEVAGNLSRDQDGFVIEAGADFDLTQLVRGEIAIGYIDIGYDEITRESFNGINLEGGVEWFATPLITVSGNVSRTVRPSEIVNSPSTFETRFGAGVDYEWRRNIILSTGAEYRDVNFRDVDRDDKWLSYYVEGSYLMNRYVSFKAGVYRSDLDSSGLIAQSDFDKTRVLFGITLRR